MYYVTMQKMILSTTSLHETKREALRYHTEIEYG